MIKVNKKKTLSSLYFQNKAEELIVNLPKRSAEIIRKRFGISNQTKKTLEKIGQEYGITRERIRQIIADALKKITKFDRSFLAEAEDRIIFAIETRSGIISQEEAIKTLANNEDKEKNALDFLVSCSKKIKTLEIKDLITPSWTGKDFSIEKIELVENIAYNFFKKEKKVVLERKLVQVIFSEIKEIEITAEDIQNWILVFDRIKANGFGKWGLSSWSEISPKNTRDKIYVILKEKKEPLHFTQIAKLIDENGLAKKKAHPQTVHNELIKDKRFILIGRGIYALSEWGYTEGTVREVIEKILKEKGPLEKDKLFEEIFKIRKVKSATVMINLNNTNFFTKEKDLYKLK